MKKCLLEMHIHLKSIHLIALTTLNFKLCITEIRERLLKGLRKKEILRVAAVSVSGNKNNTAIGLLCCVQGAATILIIALIIQGNF